MIQSGQANPPGAAFFAQRFERRYRGDPTIAAALSIRCSKELAMEEASVLVFVGVDWATPEHQVCAFDPSGELLGKGVVPHTAREFERLCKWLLELCHGDPGRVWVGIEVPTGRVVETPSVASSRDSVRSPPPES